MRPTFEKGKPRMYRCASRETPAGPCGSRRAPADDLERWAWDEVAGVLRDPSRLAARIAERREQAADPEAERELWAAREAAESVEARYRGAARRFALLGDDAGEDDVLAGELRALREAWKGAQARVSALEAAGAARDATDAILAGLVDFARLVADRLEALDFDGRRDALDALGVEVLADGGHWAISGTDPETGGGILDTCRRTAPRPPRSRRRAWRPPIPAAG
jgi:hypothetical protein